MLNERQEYLLKSMLMNFKGEERKTKKYHIYCISPFYKTVEKDKFNASTAARIMTDDRKAINKHTTYYIVADKRGWFIKTKYEHREILVKREESLLKSLKMIRIELKNFVLDGQVREG